jgi:hypothetical protein
MVLQEVRWGLDWINLAQEWDRDWGGGCCSRKRGNEPSGRIKCEEFLD